MLRYYPFYNLNIKRHSLLLLVSFFFSEASANFSITVKMQRWTFPALFGRARLGT